MALRLYYHPLSSYCWKALIALYETGVPFEGEIVDLSDADARERFMRMTPLGKFPVLVDEETGKGFPESSIIIEYISMKHAGAAKLIPADRDLALRVRLSDRFYDLYIHDKMQRIVGDRLRDLRARRTRRALRSGLTNLKSRCRWLIATWPKAAGRPGLPSPWLTAQRRRRSTTPTRCRRLVIGMQGRRAISTG
jgi:glutathione S-transferase